MTASRLEALVPAVIGREIELVRLDQFDNTAVFIHRLPADISTGSAVGARAVRVQIVTPPGALSRAGQRQITTEATALIAAAVVAGERVRTWVILTEAAEGGWGIDGTGRSGWGVRGVRRCALAPSVSRYSRSIGS